MAYKIQWAESAAKEYAKLDKPIREQIDKFIAKLSERDDPTSLGKPLTANLSGLWRYRVGNYRIGAKIHKEVFTVLIVAVKHRSIVYK
jgi:mRNA interferase RelE/StbE